MAQHAPSTITKRVVDKVTTVLLIACVASLLLSFVLTLFTARNWPLVGDAALMHYVVFLLQGGHAPYREIVDINLPGSYLLEAASMKLFGTGAIGLRLYDSFLCLLLCLLFTLFGQVGWRGRVTGLSAGIFFVLIHLQDGFAQAAQREFAMAVLVVGAYVILLGRTPGSRLSAIFFFELLIGLSLTIKPTLLPLAALPLLLPNKREQQPPRNPFQILALALLGLSVAPASVLLWLWRWHSLRAFASVTRSIAVLHSQLGRRGLLYLLSHSTSPIDTLVIAWLMLTCLVLFALPRRSHDTHRVALLFGVLCGLFSYLAQAKGYPYQRYPFLALLLLWIARDLPASLFHPVSLFSPATRFGRADSRIGSRIGSRILALGVVCLACLWYAPRFAWLTRTFKPEAPFEQALAMDLRSRHAAQAEVQCLDTFGGCINTLYDLRLTQSTGYLYDCYLFTPEGPTQAAYRASFLHAFDEAHPKYIVLTDQFCFDGKTGFDRVGTWQALETRLNNQYTVVSKWHPPYAQRWWSRSEIPSSYRLYASK